MEYMKKGRRLDIRDMVPNVDRTGAYSWAAKWNAIVTNFSLSYVSVVHYLSVTMPSNQVLFQLAALVTIGRAQRNRQDNHVRPDNLQATKSSLASTSPISLVPFEPSLSLSLSLSLLPSVGAKLVKLPLLLLA